MKRQLVASGLAFALGVGSLVATSTPTFASTAPSSIPEAPKPTFTQHPNSIDVKWDKLPEGATSWFVSASFPDSTGNSYYPYLWNFGKHVNENETSTTLDTTAIWQELIEHGAEPAAVEIRLSGNYKVPEGNRSVQNIAEPQVPLLPNGKLAKLPQYSTKSKLTMLSSNLKEVIQYRRPVHKWANEWGLSLRASFSRKPPVAAMWFTAKGSKHRKRIGTVTFYQGSLIQWDDPPTTEYSGTLDLGKVPGDGKITISYSGTSGTVLMGNQTFANLKDTAASYSVNVTRGWVKFTNKGKVKISRSPRVLKVKVQNSNASTHNTRVALQRRKGKRWITVKRKSIWRTGQFVVKPKKKTRYRLKVDDPYRYSVVSKPMTVYVKK